MTWMETCRLLGVDLFIVMLIVVAALNGIGHVVRRICSNRRNIRGLLRGVMP